MTLLSIDVIKRNETDGCFSKKIQSVNLHITKACNYRCRFCYAHFNQVGTHLNKDQWIEVIFRLGEAGCSKITFVGGEPTLVPYLHELVIFAKEQKMTTMLVTNGSRITDEYLNRFNGCLDWVGLSIDTGKENISKKLGRGTGKHVEQTIRLSSLLKKNGIRIKVNSVITALNWEEDMNWLIELINPERWKVFQVLPIDGENDDANDLLITSDQFNEFIKRHSSNAPVAENNDSMLESYVMVDPEGRFFTNSGNKLTHTGSILELGVEEAFQRADFKLEKFEKRGGLYNWGNDKE